jgi:hypothetical protein
MLGNVADATFRGGEEKVMETDDIQRILSGWFERKAADAPTMDPRRTAECLRFADLSAVASYPECHLARSKRSHIETCGWCQRALASTRSVLEPVAAGGLSASLSGVGWEAPSSVRRGSMEAAVPPVLSSSVPAGRLSPAVRAQLAVWLRESAAGPEEFSPAVFDEAGTLHIVMEGLPADGPVRVSLVVEGLSLHVSDAAVSHGRLEVTRPMPEYGVQNLRLAPSAVDLQDLSEPS